MSDESAANQKRLTQGNRASMETDAKRQHAEAITALVRLAAAAALIASNAPRREPPASADRAFSERLAEQSCTHVHHQSIILPTPGELPRRRSQARR